MPWPHNDAAAEHQQTHAPVPTIVTINPQNTGHDHHLVNPTTGHRSDTLDSSASSSFGGDGFEVRHRRGHNLFRGVLNRLRVAAHLSRARRAEAGNEAEPDVSAVLGDMQLEVRRTNEHLNRISYSRQVSNKSQRITRTPSHKNSHPVLAPKESVMSSTTRDYTLAKGSVHFWRNFAFETEVNTDSNCLPKFRHALVSRATPF